MMKYIVAVVIGIIAYIIYFNCNYDLGQEQDLSRTAFLLRIDRKRVLLIALFWAVALPVTWLFSFYGYGPLKTVRYCLLLAFLFPIAREDARTKQIPNRWLIYLYVIRIVIFILETVYYPSSFADNLIFTISGGIVCGGIMFIAYVVSRHAVGMGDVKLFMILGFYLGTSMTYTVMFVASALAALYGVCHMAAKKIKMRDEIAFAPFIAVAALIVIVMGF